MGVNKKRTFILFLIMNVLVLAVSVSMYFLFIDHLAKQQTENYLQPIQNHIKNKLNESFKEIELSFNKNVNLYSIEELNQSLGSGELKEAGFLVFLNYENNSFVYESHSVSIEKTNLKGYNLGFFDNYCYIFNEEVVGIVDLKGIFTEIIFLTEANDVFLMDNEGMIFLNSNVEQFKNVLHEYLPERTEEYINNYFAKKKDLIIFTTIQNEKAVVKFTNLADFDRIYVAQQFFIKDIEKTFFSISLFLMVLLAVIIILNFVVLFLIYYFLNRRNSDIENAKIKYYYDKPYILKVNKKGKIKKVNDRVNKELLGVINEKKYIAEIFNDRDLVLERVQRGKTVFLWMGEAIISFIPIKYSFGYYLVGDYITGDVMIDDDVYQLAYYNNITKIGNIHLFEKEVNQTLLDLTIHKEKNLYFVGFKISGAEKIFSHLTKVVTEKVLEEIASELKLFIKDKDVSLYHTELDEFISVLKTNSFEEAEAFVLDIIKHFEKPINISKSNVDFKISSAIVSVSGRQSSMTNAKNVYFQMVETLKRAKETTTKKYLVFDEAITHYLTEKQLIEKELEIAIENKDFIPYFQAQYHPKKDKIVGFEALIRWDNPNYINKSPITFIEIAEENGTINEIGRIMIEKTFKCAKEFEDYDVTISVNVSPIEILRQGFVGDLLDLQKKYQLKPGAITIEITETTLLQSFNIINEKIRVLKKNGFKIDLDDFGTGYSSLPYIKELDFDTIKIDKTFVDYIEIDKYNKAIVQMIISLAKTLNANVIAEGIETEAQMNYLVKAGCHIIQGFYISKPLPFQQAKKLLEDYNVNKTKSFQKKGGK